MHYSDSDRPHATSDEQVKFGVIAYGYWGPNIVFNFANTDGCHVVGASDLDASNLMPCIRPYPGLTTTDFRDLIENRRIDAVAIATPAHRNFEINMAALRTRKHVTVENPLTQTSDQVCRLIDEPKRRKPTLMIDHTFVYTPAVQKLPQLISEGVLGEIFYCNGTCASFGFFQNDINVIWDHAEHDFSNIQYILNEAPVTVSASAATNFSGTPENMGQITLFFEGSCVAHINVTWLSPIKVRQTFNCGGHQMIVYDDVEPTEKIKVYDKGITLDLSDHTEHQLRIGCQDRDMWAPHLVASAALNGDTGFDRRVGAS